MVDFFGGQADLKDHVVRVLHNLSFVEDPTRSFRAVRFERRYGFTMGKQTLALLQSAVRNQLFNRLSGRRLFTELRLILRERRPAGAIARMKELGLLRFIHPSLDFNEKTEQIMDRCEDLIAWRALAFPDQPVEEWLVRFLAMTDQLDEGEMAELPDRFPTEQKIINGMIDARALIEKAMKKIVTTRTMTPSALYEALRPISVEALLFMAAREEDSRLRKGITSYLSELKDTKPFVTGDDLVSLGLPSSPKLGRVLRKTFEAQLDRRINSREEAMVFAKGLMESGGG